MGNKIVKTTTGGNLLWTDQTPAGFTPYLRDVSAVDGNTAWAVGERGQIWKTANGTTWVAQTSGTTNNLWGVEAFSAEVAFAVGENGTMLRTLDGGAQWVALSPGTSQHLMSISTTDAYHLLAVGSNGTILRSSDVGQTWTSDYSGTGAYLRGVTMIDALNAWAVGHGGTILRVSDGVTWFSQDSGTQQDLKAVSGVSSDIAWAVGTNSTVLKTVDGGEDAAVTAYFAEGCTRPGFEEWISLQNPGSGAIEVRVRYLGSEGVSIADRAYSVPAASRTSINVNQDAGTGKDVSAKLWSSATFYAERSMYFEYQAYTGIANCVDGSVAAAVPTPRQDWYFAEGCTRSGFEEWLCVMNPTADNASFTIDYTIAGGEPVSKTYGCQANSRVNVYVNGDVGPDKDVSAHVHSVVPLVIERPMYFNYNSVLGGGVWTGGHVVMGANEPQQDWYFAEGTTRPGFEEYLCIQNPNDVAANAVIIYSSPDAAASEQLELPANSRTTIFVNQKIGLGVDVSCRVVADQLIICERPMYFNYTGYGAGGWSGGSDVMGSTAAKADWYFPEGCTLNGFHQYLCISNPGEDEAAVTVTYNIKGASPKQVTHKVGGLRRFTVLANSDAGGDLEFSTAVHSTLPVSCERSMYFSYRGMWDGGTSGTGF
ncbi:MAG: WD40/YVTN/BNR-like repeat-containing protein [Candidatus Geothermincolia bacterium]